jgi:hypothetical protein
MGTLALSQTPMQVANNHYARCRAQNEVAARAALELRVGHSLTDAEWADARARLVEFVSILRAWERESIAPRRGNVEVLCQREQ